MHGELAPLGISVTIVEPGAFRTDFAGRSLTQSTTPIDDYADTAGRRRKEHDMAYTVLSITGKWGYVCRWTKKLVGGVVIIEAEFPKDEWPPLETVRVVGVVRRFEAQS